MKSSRYFVLVFGLLAASIVFAAGARELLDRSEKLWLENKFVESNKALDDAMSAGPNGKEKAEIYWRKSRNLYDMAEGMDREEKAARMRNYMKMQELCKKCIDMEPNVPECYLFYATGIGREGTQKGILNALGRIKEVEELYLKVIELRPRYRSPHGEGNTLGDAYYALGVFYRLVPEWTPIKLIYKTRGDKKKSVEMMRKAVQLEPERIEYVKELGISLICYGQNRKDQKIIDEGVNQLKKIQGMTEYKPTDKIDKQHAGMVLADLKTACGYSRDAQQEVSREAYEKKR